MTLRHVEPGWPRTLVLGGVILGAVLGPGFALQGRLPPAPAVAGTGAVARPNIVLIQTDDQTYRQLTRSAMPQTRRLLARRGTKFTDYVASTAQCCPSRASLITGQYAHNHGVTSNNVGYAGLIDKGNVLPVWLRRAGYRTIHVGKFMNGYGAAVEPDSVVPPGWDQWHSVLGSREYYRYDLHVNGTVTTAEAAVETMSRVS
ncbi:MAG TPA: sulfatase-like hydrolase/transferase [Solirubrobacterales bacterium]|nr:sulfatase-like hydrolase/transferase [Solirubrobacterales bacterium]